MIIVDGKKSMISIKQILHRRATEVLEQYIHQSIE